MNTYSNYSMYASLGQSCQTSMRILSDSKKFFPVNDPVYDMFYTKMKKYPSSTNEVPNISVQVEKPEDIKTKIYNQNNTEEYRGNNCCGKR